MSSWNNNLTLLKDGDTANSALFNSRLQVLKERTEYLKQQLENIVTDNYSLMALSPVDEEVSVGDVVYYDTTYSTYKKALAESSQEYGDYGQLLPSEKSFVIGIVSEKPTVNTAKAVTSGIITDTSLITSLLGASPSPGIYFLADNNPGGLSTERPGFPVPVGIYSGDGKFLIGTPYHNYPNHLHRTFELDAGFQDTFLFDDTYIVPEGVVEGYKLEDDSDFQSVFSGFQPSAVLIQDGTHMPRDQYVFNQSNLWLKISSSGHTYSVALQLPVNYGDPIVRAIQSSNTDQLSIQALDGLVVMALADWETDGTDITGQAVSEVSGRKYKTTPVITGISTGPGASASVNGQGEAVISFDEYLHNLYDLSLVNMNSALYTVINDIPYIQFPKNRIASVEGLCKIPKFSAASATAKLAIWVKGISGAAEGSEIAIPQLAVEYTPVGKPSDGSPVDLSGLTTTGSNIPAMDSVQEKLYYAEAGDGAEVFSDTLLRVRLSLTSSSSHNININRIGCIITPSS